MLLAINWRMNPPTVMSFVRMILDFIPKNRLNFEDKQILLETTKEQVTAIANEYNFAVFDASSIAFASLLNSIESHFNMAIKQLLQLDDCVCIATLRRRIFEHINKSY